MLKFAGLCKSAFPARPVPAGLGSNDAFEALISLEPYVRFTSGLICWAVISLLQCMGPVMNHESDYCSR